MINLNLQSKTGQEEDEEDLVVIGQEEEVRRKASSSKKKHSGGWLVVAFLLMLFSAGMLVIFNQPSAQQVVQAKPTVVEEPTQLEVIEPVEPEVIVEEPVEPEVIELRTEFGAGLSEHDQVVLETIHQRVMDNPAAVQFGIKPAGTNIQANFELATIQGQGVKTAASDLDAAAKQAQAQFLAEEIQYILSWSPSELAAAQPLVETYLAALYELDPQLYWETATEAAEVLSQNEVAAEVVDQPIVGDGSTTSKHPPLVMGSVPRWKVGLGLGTAGFEIFFTDFYRLFIEKQGFEPVAYQIVLRGEWLKFEVIKVKKISGSGLEEAWYWVPVDIGGFEEGDVFALDPFTRQIARYAAAEWARTHQ